MPAKGQRRDPVDRFVEKVEIADGCWKWTAKLNHLGYGKFFISREQGEVYAHRFAWESFVGPIPQGLVIDHVRDAGCTSTACVNPDHLEPVTQLVNVRRGRRAQRTHCDHGHEFTPENTRITSVGRRRCRECERIRWRSPERLAKDREWRRSNREKARAATRRYRERQKAVSA